MTNVEMVSVPVVVEETVFLEKERVIRGLKKKTTKIEEGLRNLEQGECTVRKIRQHAPPGGSTTYYQVVDKKLDITYDIPWW